VHRSDGCTAAQRLGAAEQDGAAALACGTERPGREGAFGLLTWARAITGPQGKERRGRKTRGSSGKRSRPKREEGEKGRPGCGLGWLTSLFLSPFVLFFFKLTQFYLNSNEI
jgi:hypothetical protein